MTENRYRGDYPVIGIRPTIDARRGALQVRESLEAQTRAMAEAAAKLCEENLRGSNRAREDGDFQRIYRPCGRGGCLRR